jgi:hypothetical protein
MDGWIGPRVGVDVMERRGEERRGEERSFRP